MLRIIAGKHKGRILKAPLGEQTRPSKDMLKEALFSSLHNLYGWSVLDLFAGSGAVGLEALSRGASSLTLVDEHDNAIRCIKENVSSLKEEALILQCDALTFLKQTETSFDLIFMDPPYFFESKEELFDTVHQRSLLNEDGLLVYEQEAREKIMDYPHFICIKEKKYGVSRLCYYREEKK